MSTIEARSTLRPRSQSRSDKFLGKGLDVEKMAGVVDKSLYRSQA